MIGASNWVVKLDDGKANSYGSMQSAADTVREVLKTGNAAEMWHMEDGQWSLYERFEPDAEPDRGRPLPGSKSEQDPMSRTCEDCGAEPGQPCAWSCSSNWR